MYGLVKNLQRAAVYVQAIGVPYPPESGKKRVLGSCLHTCEEEMYGLVKNLQRAAVYLQAIGVPVGARPNSSTHCELSQPNQT